MEIVAILAVFLDANVKPEEMPQIPRLAKTPSAIAYAPLGDVTFKPDAALFACKPAGAMLLQEAAGRAGIGSGTPALGRTSNGAGTEHFERGSWKRMAGI